MLCDSVLFLFSPLYMCLVDRSHPSPPSPLCPSSPEPPGSSLRHRELFCPSAQCIGQQQSVFFWSQRPPPLPAGSTKTWSYRQPASGQHRPHEGKDARACVRVCGIAAWFILFLSSTKSIEFTVYTGGVHINRGFNKMRK